MKVYAAIMTYERPVVLRECLRTFFANTRQPDEVDIIDNASGDEVQTVIFEERSRSTLLNKKAKNLGATDSGRIALARARQLNPDVFFLIEADYIFRPWAFETVIDVFENIPEGQMALGISGYDHPFFYKKEATEKAFPFYMACQVGEDNVNRKALYQPFYAGRYVLELVSNTCPTCYLNWKKIQEVAAEFPELNRYLDEAMDPQENPNYPPSGEYAKKNIIDDGMLSHGISLIWNRWAIKHEIDRDRFGAWLNIKPSVANNISGGGQHATTGLKEMQTDGGSPSWT